MKKFTKFCMITALFTFIMGCLLFGIGVLFGGLRQLEHINVKAVTGIPFGFVNNSDNWSFGFWDGYWDDEWKEYWEWDSKEWKSVEKVVDGAHNSEEHGEWDTAQEEDTGVAADALRKLELEAGACKMIIEESDKDTVSIAVTGECKDHYRYRVKGGDTLMLVHKDMEYDDYGHFWNRSHPKGNTRVYLYLPENVVLDEISIDFGAGELDAGYLRAREIEIDVGAGECHFAGLEASESIELTMGAGELTTERLITKKASLDIAAGEMRIDGAQVSEEADVNLSMGNATIQGTFAGELNGECSMGQLSFVLDGAQQDYNYDVDCGFGDVWIGNKRYRDLEDDYEINNGNQSSVDVSCSMGTVHIDFTEE